MKTPQELTNDELALHLELWTVLNDQLSDSQIKYFDELIWRLRLFPDKELEKLNE